LSISHSNLNHSNRTRGAASYKASIQPGWLTLPYFGSFLLALELLALIALPTWRGLTIAWVLLGVSLPVAAWLTLRVIILRKVLTSPFYPPPSLTNPHWEIFRFKGWGNSTLTGRHLRAEAETKDKPKGLVLYLHGYGSSLSFNESRIEHLVELGLDVVGMDMRGHGHCDLRQDWTLLKVVADAEALLESVVERYEEPVEKVWIYGHSVGGFIGMWLASHPSGWWAERLQGLMLESPATSFPMVIESKNNPLLRPLRGWFRQILRREFERIHPDLKIRYANSQVPHFGMPKVEMLVLQAEHDSHLGTAHYDLLMQHVDENLCTSYLLKGHEHTSTKDSSIRRRTLEQWLQPYLGPFLEPSLESNQGASS